MRLASIFCIIALLPAALNTTPALARGMLAAPLCTGDGVARVINLPMGPASLPGSEPPGCCVKGCHAGGARKRGAKHLDQAQ